MERKRTKRKRKNTSSKRKAARHQFRPFGKFAEPLSTDTSDSDYVPDEFDDGEVDKKRKEDDSKSCLRNDAKCQDVNKRTDKDKSSATCSAPKVKGGAKLWNKVPTEILVKIFKFLVVEENGILTIIRCGRVCTQWNYCSKHPSLWSRVDLSFMSNYTRANDASIKKLVKLHGDKIEHLLLSNWKQLTSKGLLAISEECENLETLGISGCSENTRKGKGINAESVMTIINKCNIKAVDFSWVKLPNFSKVLQALVDRGGKNLIGLNLCGCPVRLSMINTVMDQCPNLEVLDISNTLIYDINIVKLQSSFPHLVELYIAKSHVFSKAFGLKSSDDQPTFKNMKALSIQSELLTDEVLARTTKGAKDLKLLDLRSCRMLTSRSLMEMEASNIERLFLSHSCAAFSMRHILEKWGSSLQELDLSWISAGAKLEDKELGSIAKTGIKYSKMTKLDLSGTSVNDLGVCHVVTIFPRLESLNLTSCKGLSRGIKHLHGRKSIQLLRKMNSNPSAKQEE